MYVQFSHQSDLGSNKGLDGIYLFYIEKKVGVQQTHNIVYFFSCFFLVLSPIAV